MKTINTDQIKLTAANALNDKYGFGPVYQQVILLESDGEGTYILFRVGEHEYRFEDGEVTNIEDQKKLDTEADTWLEIHKMQQAKIDELKSKLRWQERKTKLAEIEKRTFAEKTEELKKTLHYRELALDEAAKKRDELETKNRQLCNDLAGERWIVRILKEKLENNEKPPFDDLTN